MKHPTENYVLPVHRTEYLRSSGKVLTIVSADANPKSSVGGNATLGGRAKGKEGKGAPGPEEKGGGVGEKEGGNVGEKEGGQGEDNAQGEEEEGHQSEDGKDGSGSGREEEEEEHGSAALNMRREGGFVFNDASSPLLRKQQHKETTKSQLRDKSGAEELHMFSPKLFPRLHPSAREKYVRLYKVALGKSHRRFKNILDEIR